MIRICFVCLGNICRSPTAEGVMRHLVTERGLSAHFHIESAGTGGWHVGDHADPRSRAAARRRGFLLAGLAQQFARGDFERFDYVLAADGENRKSLLALAPDETARRKVHRLREFDAASRDAGDLDVPDPYYGGDEGFERVLDVCEAACLGLLEHLATEL